MDLKDLIAKKKDQASDLDPMYKSAKMGSLKDIHKLATDALGDDVKGLKKVTVAAPSADQLKAGLDKAKEMLSGKSAIDPDMDQDDDSSEEGDDDADHEQMEDQATEHMHEANEEGKQAEDMMSHAGHGDSGELTPEEEEMLAHLLEKKLGK